MIHLNPLVDAIGKDGVLALESETYFIDKPITIDRPIWIVGAGQTRTKVKVQGEFDAFRAVCGDPVVFEDFTIEGAGKGSGFVLGTGSVINRGSRFRDLTIGYFERGIEARAASMFHADGCYMVDNWLGFDIHNVVHPDVGDSSIQRCTLDTSKEDHVAILMGSSGGLRIINNKILHYNHGFCLWLDDGAQTSDVIIMGNSFELQKEACVSAYHYSSGGLFQNFQVIGNQMISEQMGVVVVNVDNVIVTGNLIQAPTKVSLVGVQHSVNSGNL